MSTQRILKVTCDGCGHVDTVTVVEAQEGKPTPPTPRPMIRMELHQGTHRFKGDACGADCAARLMADFAQEVAE